MDIVVEEFVAGRNPAHFESNHGSVVGLEYIGHLSATQDIERIAGRETDAEDVANPISLPAADQQGLTIVCRAQRNHVFTLRFRLEQQVPFRVGHLPDAVGVFYRAVVVSKKPVTGGVTHPVECFSSTFRHDVLTAVSNIHCEQVLPDLHYAGAVLSVAERDWRQHRVGPPPGPDQPPLSCALPIHIRP
ncbi:MAG: hypothetical protein AAFX10_11415, partial [Pseudomonadota bacterium]